MKRTVLILCLLALILSFAGCSNTCERKEVGDITITVPKNIEKSESDFYDYLALTESGRVGVRVFKISTTANQYSSAKGYLDEVKQTYGYVGTVIWDFNEPTVASMSYTLESDSNLRGYVTVRIYGFYAWVVDYMENTEVESETDYIELFKDWASEISYNK